MRELKCPKDDAPLRSYERNGVTVERCSECGGIFLDRGELERLIAAVGTEDPSGGPGQRQRGSDVDEGGQYGGERPRRRSWLSDLLDGG